MIASEAFIVAFVTLEAVKILRTALQGVYSTDVLLQKQNSQNLGGIATIYSFSSRLISTRYLS